MSLSTVTFVPDLSTCPLPPPCHLQMDDAGRYQCLATNEMGTVKKVVTLVLQSEFLSLGGGEQMLRALGVSCDREWLIIRQGSLKPGKYFTNVGRNSGSGWKNVAVIFIVVVSIQDSKPPLRLKRQFLHWTCSSEFL